MTVHIDEASTLATRSPGAALSDAGPVPGRRAQVVLAAAGAAAALTYVGVRNPHDRGVVMPRCPFHWVTGLDCPGCGGLRMTHDLLHGNLAAAFADNAVLLILAPLLVFLVVRAAHRWTYGRTAPTHGAIELNGRAGIALAAIGFTWAVVRNLAGW